MVTTTAATGPAFCMTSARRGLTPRAMSVRFRPLRTQNRNAVAATPMSTKKAGMAQGKVPEPDALQAVLQRLRERLQG